MSNEVRESIKSALLILVAVSFFIYSLMVGNAWALDSFTVHQIKYASAVRDGVNVMVPTLVKGTKSGVAVAEWGAAKVTPAIGSKILGKFITGAGVLGMAYIGADLVSYLYDKSFSYIQGELNKTVQGSSTNNYPWLENNGPCGGSTIRFATSAAACAAGWCSCSYVHDFPNHIYKYTGSEGCGHAGETACEPEAAYESQVQNVPGQETTNPATSQQVAELVTAIETDLNNQVGQAEKVLDQVMNKVENAISSDEDPITKAKPQTVADIKTELKNSVQQGQKDSMDAQAQQEDAQKKYGDQSSQLTKGDVQDVINKAVGSPGDVTGPVIEAETLPTIPQKITITSVITDWWSGFQSLPVISMFTGMSVTASGSPVISFDIPAFIGGSATNFTYDMSQHESVWSFMGNILLMITGVRWTMYLFEG